MKGTDGRHAEGTVQRGSPGERPSRVHLSLSLVCLTALTSPLKNELCPDLQRVPLFGISMPSQVPLHLPGAPSPIVPALLAAPPAASSDAHPVRANLALLWHPCPLSQQGVLVQ